MEVDIETDELLFFPLLYWPVVPGEAQPSPQAVERLNRFLATGGMICSTRATRAMSTPFSAARPQAQPAPARGRARYSAADAGPPDHVLTKSFYLMQEFPGPLGRRQVWVEPAEDPSMTASPASSSAATTGPAPGRSTAASGRCFRVVPGGEPQREIAYRFGVNLVMYALTGNYKTDQVHVPAILERLGQ